MAAAAAAAGRPAASWAANPPLAAGRVHAGEREATAPGAHHVHAHGVACFGGLGVPSHMTSADSAKHARTALACTVFVSMHTMELEVIFFNT